MTTPILIPRNTWHPGDPTTNNGSPRPPLRQPVLTITRHYTGSPIRARNSTDTAQTYMPWMQQRAQASGKSFEYNYLIPPRLDGSAQVWEYAGTYLAAHSAGENTVAIGVQFALGVDNHPSYANYDRTKPTVWEPLTDEMVDAYRWLRDAWLIPNGIVDVNVTEVEHRHMPGAATACPGQSVIERSDDLDAPWNPPTPEENIMLLWRPQGFKNVFAIEAANAIQVTERLMAAWGKTHADVIVEHHPQMLESVLFKSGLEVGDLVPE